MSVLLVCGNIISLSQHFIRTPQNGKDCSTNWHHREDMTRQEVRTDV